MKYLLNLTLRRTCRDMANTCALIAASCQANKYSKKVYERFARLAFKFTKLSQLKVKK